MRRLRAAWGGLALVTLAVLTARPRPVAAQEQQTRQQQTDSAKARAERLLRRLARSAGSDSLLYVQDSLAKAELAAHRPAGGATGGDSTLAALSRMRGYVLTQYKGTEASYDAKDRVLVLQGGGTKDPTSVTREGTEVQADSSIVYHEGTGLVVPRGSPVVTPPEGQGSPLKSRSLVFDTKKGYGTARDARTTYAQGGGGANWIVAGDMPFAAPDSTFISPASFTSCDINPPHYHFATSKIKIIAGKVLVARPVKLYFADVPVAWLPFIAQSLSRGRASGILTPLFSLNDIVRTSSSYHRRISNIGYYWAMSQYTDASAALDWFSGKWLALTGDFRYKVTRQFLNGNLDLRRYWLDNGGRQLALSTSNSWQPDENTQVRLSGSYASSASFVEQNTFDPQEVTRSISSQGGINRRFSWGTLSLAANRQQYLSNNSTDLTLPSLNLSLSPITLFAAAPSEAHFWNNMTWSGSATASRETFTYVQPDTFSISQASTENRQASASSNLSMGNLTFSQSANLQENTTLGVPNAYIRDPNAPVDSLLRGAPSRDVTNATLNWSGSLGYQQHLIGSTTLTPSLSFSGQMIRSDTSSLAQGFVSAPIRLNLGASLSTNLYGFYPGFGGYTAIRHKLSPSFSFAYSPAVTPTPLQADVFGQLARSPLKTLSVTLQQTFEAKGKPPAKDTTAKNATDSAAAGGPANPPRAPITTLLAISTSVVNYDFVRADSLGFFLGGFSTTQLQNQISSDFLRGLSISFTHDLFKDQTNAQGRLVSRTFSPHLSQMNLSFALGSQSRVFRWLGALIGGQSSDTTQAAEPASDTTTIGSGALTSQSSVIPTQTRARLPLTGGATGGWRAQISYALQRPRGQPSLNSQMLQLSLSMKPTANWDLRWQTSYDVQHGRFDDHTVSLTRDLHRWQANFDFFQTATGNWTFRFQVSLIDNRDLKFNYAQNSTDFPQQ